MLFALALAIAVPMPSPPPVRVWTLAELTDEQMRELDHRIIFVRGWINGCDHGLRRGFDCNIAADPSDESRHMNLGGRPPVFRELRAAADNEAVLRVRVDAACHYPEVSVCLENSTDLITLGVVRIIRPKRS